MSRTLSFIKENYWALPRNELRKLLACLDDDDFWSTIDEMHVGAALTPPEYHCYPFRGRPAKDSVKITLLDIRKGKRDVACPHVAISFTVASGPTSRGTRVWLPIYFPVGSKEDIVCRAHDSAERALEDLIAAGLGGAAHQTSGLRNFLLGGETFDGEWMIGMIVLP